jgi:hypothetical protein
VRRLPLFAAVLVGLAPSCRLGTDARTPVGPQLVFSPDSLAFHGRAGAAVLPDQYLSLSLDANASARWLGFEDGSWLELGNGAGTLPYFLPVEARPAGLPAGSYSANIWIAMPTYTVHIPVTLQLDTAASLSGRWVAAQDSLRLALDLSDSAGTVTGSGTAGPPVREVVVAGARADTTVSLTLTAADITLRFTGSLVGDNALAGTLSGAGMASVALTLYRQ